MSQLLAEKTAFATPLLLYAYDLIGDEIFDLEPETIEQILKQQNHKTLQRNVDKVNAALGLLTTNLFWQDPITFAVTCRTLNRKARVNAAPPDIEDVLWGITEARLIVGNPDEENEPFSDSIVAYIEELLKMSGVVTKVPTLDFVTPPREPNIYDDAAQSLSAFDASKQRVEDMEQELGVKMATLLKQIKDLHIKLSDDASKDLEHLLKEQN